MYYPYFIVYMLIGFLLSLLVFFWALNHGQFKDQDRARYLPLQEGVVSKTARVSRVSRIEAYALIFLACSGLLATGAVLAFALIR
jgi:cbb3-type cytochrome oxidase maturation protein